ncbi:MAG TPA: CoA transferase [Acidimicrobiales bacterium]|nr:CoA transferase [Acidimicrobiales bacterium]
MTRPLEGITVLAAEQMHSLPHATQLMALMGAEVIKVEPLTGEAGRTGRPTITDVDGRATGSTFLRNNLGKASVAIDLKHPGGRALFLRLASTVDVVAENFRPGTADKLGIGYADVRAASPRIVYLSVSGFGNQTDPQSPYRDWAAYAPIVEGMAGLYEYGREGDTPPRPAIAGALGDTAPGLYAVIGTLAALRERDRSGSGCHVDISMYDSMIAVADVVHPASVGVEPSRALDGIGILHAFRASDGWFTIEVVREPHFPRFATAVGHPEWVDDARLANRTGWSTHMGDIIRPGVEQWASTRTKHQAASVLAAHGVAAGPVNTAADIVADPHVQSRDFIVEAHTPEHDVRVVANPIAFSWSLPPGTTDTAGTTTGAVFRWPVLGEGTERVLRQRLSLEPEEIAHLRETGVIA